jgi:hypothetical protein
VIRPLTLFDRLVRVPLGFAWFLVIGLVAVPVMLYMTALFFAVQAARSLRLSGGRDASPAREDEG